MCVFLDDIAQKELRQRLACQPEGTRIRIHIFGTGCRQQHGEARLTFEQYYNALEDDLFELYGMPFAIKKGSVCSCTAPLRVGLAGLPR